jgi:hypothetical protein
MRCAFPPYDRCEAVLIWPEFIDQVPDRAKLADVVIHRKERSSRRGNRFGFVQIWPRRLSEKSRQPPVEPTCGSSSASPRATSPPATTSA